MGPLVATQRTNGASNTPTDQSSQHIKTVLLRYRRVADSGAAERPCAGYVAHVHRAAVRAVGNGGGSSPRARCIEVYFVEHERLPKAFDYVREELGAM